MFRFVVRRYEIGEKTVWIGYASLSKGGAIERIKGRKIAYGTEQNTG
jgi:hypothetical protein